MNATNGQYFRREDYAGFWLRLLIDIIDSLVAVAICSALAIALWAAFPLSAKVNGLILAACAVIAFCYFVLLKRSKILTIGYRIGGVRIVGLDGRPPSVVSLILRVLFAIGPLNGLDLIWLSGDTHRQALRDKFAETYVIKRQAEPAGKGKLVYHYYEICGYSFLFREVDIEKSAIVSG